MEQGKIEKEAHEPCFELESPCRGYATSKAQGIRPLLSWKKAGITSFRCHIDSPQRAEEEGYRFPAKAAGSTSLEPRFFLPAPPKVFGPTQWRTYAEMGKLCKACTWSVA